MADFVTYPHPALSRKAEGRPVDAAMLAGGEAVLQAAREVSAFGLAAAHLGLAEPLVVMSISGDQSLRDYVILYNPEILAVGESVASGAEGSVSMPGIEVTVDRAEWCTIAYDDAASARQTMRLEHFAARVALHEIEQMNGIFFLARVSRIKRDAAIRRFRKTAAR